MSEVITVSVSDHHKNASHYRGIAMRGGIVYIRNVNRLEAALVSVADAERIETNKLAEWLIATQEQEGPP